MNRDDKKGFRWETGYEKTWNIIKENEDGMLVSNFDQIMQNTRSEIQKRRRQQIPSDDKFIRLGIMRHLFIILDVTSSMNDTDLKPSSLGCSINVISSFINEYFDQNPISQLGIILMADRKAEKLTELSGNPRYHINALNGLLDENCEGEPSLQNALTLAESHLKCLSQHSTREVILVVSSQTTCDPGDIHKTIQSLVANKITVSVLSLSVEVFVHHALAKATSGTFNVVLDPLHFKSILQDKVLPAPTNEQSDACLIQVGFPYAESFDLERYPHRRCICHLKQIIENSSTSKGQQQNFEKGIYACPRCKSAYCELPCECVVCGLTLVAAPHLARAYHHLFPLKIFTQIEDILKTSRGQNNPICSGCSSEFSPGSSAYECCNCKNLFCIACDMFIHDSVHSCPTCIDN